MIGKCSRCGSVEQEPGQLFVNQTNWNIRFGADNRSVFSAKKRVNATACLSCDQVELFLEDRADPDGPSLGD